MAREIPEKEPGTSLSIDLKKVSILLRHFVFHRKPGRDFSPNRHPRVLVQMGSKMLFPTAVAGVSFMLKI